MSTTPIYVDNNTRAYRTPYEWEAEWSDVSGETLERRHLLDRRSEPHPILDALLHDALHRVLLTSDGAIASTRAKVHGASSSGWRAPASGLHDDLNRLATMYEEARTHRARLRVIREAQEMGTRLRYGTDLALRRGTDEWRARIAADPRPCTTLAKIYGVGATTIRRIKERAGVVLKNGRPRNSPLVALNAN